MDSNIQHKKEAELKGHNFKNRITIIVACLTIFCNYLPLNDSEKAQAQNTAPAIQHSASVLETYPPMLSSLSSANAKKPRVPVPADKTDPQAQKQALNAMQKIVLAFIENR